jgi:hypothetical protein
MKMPVSPIPKSVSGATDTTPDAEVPNIGAACSDAICARGLGNRVALRFIPGSGPRESITFASPRDVVFVDALTKTKSGKIMRRLLRARYLGLPEGDLSTLEE